MIGISRKFSRKLLCLAAASACAGTVAAGPAGFALSAGSASYAPAVLTVTSGAARTQISWQSFNVAPNEVVRFVQPNAQSSVLNHVFNPQSLNLLGGLSSNGSVLFMISGVVYGAGTNVDLAAAVNTSLRFPQASLVASGAASAAQLRSLATLADGRIYVIGQDMQAVSEASGDVLLNPGMTIELAHVSMPNLRVALTSPPGETINLSRLVGSKGDTGIFAGLFRVPAAARRAAERDVDVTLVASAQEHAPTNPDIEKSYRYAPLYARMRSEAPRDEGGLMKVAASSNGWMVLPTARSRSRPLPEDIEIGAPVQKSAEAAVALPSAPRPAPEPVATLEPQPMPAAGENEPERNRVALFARAPALPAVEVVVTLEPQPIPAAGENESERNRVAMLALAPTPPAAEVVATIEPQPVLLHLSPEPEDIRTLAFSPPVAAPVQAKLAQAPGPENNSGQVRKGRNSAPAVMVVALAQDSAAPAAKEDSNVKEVRIERRAPRYFTDYRGAMFFM